MIETLYVVNHAHTDIGFTDHQDLCFRQHAEFIEQALDLCDETASHPEEARYRWVCEVTGTTERYLESASPARRERFLRRLREGSVDVAGLQYNLTPLLDVEQLHRALYPVRRLRERHGVEIEAAMQCDVNGVSWLYADLLPQAGITFLTMAVNPVRGGVPQPRPSAFWWQGPAGGRVLVWHGYHYLFGRSTAKLGDWRFVEETLPPLLHRLEEDPSYPFDFLYCQATHPVRVDNGPPDRRMSDFVRDWNASGARPRIEFTTPRAFGRLLRERHGASLPVRSGDWTDWWADGVASSAYETGLNRGTHEILAAAEALGAWRAGGGRPWDTGRLDRTYEQATLYDEHTWGSFASIDAPRSAWTRAQWNRKASFAYTAWAEAHDVLARAARDLGSTVAEPAPDGRFNLGELDPEEAYPPTGVDELLVVNTMPWERRVVVDEPELRGGAAPVGMLEMFVPRGLPWGGEKPPSPRRRVAGTVPALGYAFLPLSQGPGEDDLRSEPGCIENVHYRVRIDPRTGAVVEWFDKALGRDLAGEHRGWRPGQYVYERVDSPAGRDALFAGDFSDDLFGHWCTDTPWRRETATEVVVGEPEIALGRASISIGIRGPGIRGGICTVALESGRRELEVDWILDKEHVTDPEAVFIAFPFALGDHAFTVDLNGVACSPDADQLPGTVRDWYPVQRWVDVSDGEAGVTMVPIDAPLVQLGGITSGRALARLEPESATLMSWALQNHWMVNFKASQGGEIPLRYRLTSHAGPCDPGAAARFAAEQCTPALALRDLRRTGPERGSFLSVPPESGVLVTAKPAEDGDGVIVRLRNTRRREAATTLTFGAPAPRAAKLCSPLEEDGATVPIATGRLELTLGPAEVRSLRLRF